VLASVPRIAIVHCARVAIITSDWHVYASFGGANVLSAGVVVIASVGGARGVTAARYDGDKHATLFSIAIVLSTPVAIVANEFRVSTSFIHIAIVNCAAVSVITVKGGVRASSSRIRARVDGTFVVVLATHCVVHASAVGRAVVLGAHVIVIATYRDVYASLFGVTQIIRTRISVITFDGSEEASSFSIALIIRADVVVVALHGSGITSLLVVALVVCACVLVVAVRKRLGASNTRVTVRLDALGGRRTPHG
jgi:hypothetical protein